MLKFILMVVVALILWKVLMPGDRSERRSADRRQAPPPEPARPETMVACAHCGLHLPDSDALSLPGEPGQTLHFCCEAHRKAGPRPDRDRN